MKSAEVSASVVVSSTCQEVLSLHTKTTTLQHVANLVLQANVLGSERLCRPLNHVIRVAVNTLRQINLASSVGVSHLLAYGTKSKLTETVAKSQSSAHASTNAHSEMVVPLGDVLSVQSNLFVCEEEVIGDHSSAATNSTVHQLSGNEGAFSNRGLSPILSSNKCSNVTTSSSTGTEHVNCSSNVSKAFCRSG